MIAYVRRLSRLTVLEREIKALVGRRHSARIFRTFSTAADRVRAAATYLGIEVDVLCEQLAKKSATVYARTVPPIDARLLPRRFGLGELRRLEILPLIADGTIQSLFGIDRERVIRQMPELAAVPFFMVSPDSLGVAFVALEAQLSGGVCVMTDSNTVVQGIFTQLYAYAEEASADVISLSPSGSALSYRLMRNDEYISEGSIANRATELLLTRCSESVTHGGVISVGNGKAFRSFYNKKTNEYLLIRKEVMRDAVAIRDDRAASQNLHPRPGDSSIRSILVIDDSADFLKVLVRFLTREGFTVFSAQSAVEAFTYISSTSVLPRAIVCDLHMPSLSGIDFIGKLRKEKKKFEIPTFFLTSDDSIESELVTLRSGAEAYISKGRDPRVLVAHLKRACDREAA